MSRVKVTRVFVAFSRRLSQITCLWRLRGLKPETFFLFLP